MGIDRGRDRPGKSPRRTSGARLVSLLARNWRAPHHLQLVSEQSRLPEPALIEAIKGERRAPAQPVFDLCDCYELQSTTPNPPQLWSNVLIEEVPTTSERLRGLVRRQSQAQWAETCSGFRIGSSNLAAGNAT
jgi:hypothetical protein